MTHERNTLASQPTIRLHSVARPDPRLQASQERNNASVARYNHAHLASYITVRLRLQVECMQAVRGKITPIIYTNILKTDRIVAVLA